LFKTALSQNVERLQLRTIITIASGYGYGLWVKIGTQKWKVDIKFIKKHIFSGAGKNILTHSRVFAGQRDNKRLMALVSRASPDENPTALQ